MNDAEEIKQKKLEELKQQYVQQQTEEQKQLEAEAQLSALLRKILTDEARTRLNNVKLVNRELYLKTSQTIMYLVQAKRLQGKMNEAELKELLLKLSAKKEINIKRK